MPCYIRYCDKKMSTKILYDFQIKLIIIHYLYHCHHALFYILFYFSYCGIYKTMCTISGMGT